MSKDIRDTIGEVVVCNGLLGRHLLGRAIAYHSTPTVVVEKEDGQQRTVGAGNIEIATNEEQINYWKTRAAMAERKAGRA